MSFAPNAVEAGNGKQVTTLPEFNFNNLRKNLVGFLSRSFEHKKIKYILYRAPEVRQYWDDEQEKVESGWAELFFDLIYVAMAFKLGLVIKEELKEDVFSFRNFFLFVLGQFLPMYEAWYRRTNYMARFVGDSLTHKFIDIIENILVGYMALFIGTRKQIEGSLSDKPLFQSRSLADDDFKSDLGINILLGFTISKILFHLVYILRYLEIRYLTITQPGKRKEGVKNMTGYALRQQIVSFILTSISSILIIQNEIMGALITLIISYVIVSFIFSYLYLNFNTTHFGVPYNAFFLISRFGEFTMLMLGEGILQTIIIPIGNNVPNHLITFGLSYLILNTLEFIKFYMLPENPYKHVLGKSVWRTPIVLLLYPVLFCSFICIGVALALVVERNDILAQQDPKNDRIRSLLAISLSIVVANLVLKNILHTGLYDLFFHTDFNRDLTAKRSYRHVHHECTKPNNLRGTRLSFSFFFLSLSFAFLVLVPIRLEAVPLLLICFFLLFLIFVVSVVERVLFTDDFKDPRGDHSFIMRDFLKLLSEPAKQSDLDANNRMWKEAYQAEEENIEVKEAYSLQVERRKKQLNQMLQYMKAHSNYLQEKIGRTHVERSSLEKVERFLDEVHQLRLLTTLIEENLYFLFSQHVYSLPNIIKRQDSSEFGRASMHLEERKSTVGIEAKYSDYFEDDLIQRSISEQTMYDEEDRDSALGDNFVQDEERYIRETIVSSRDNPGGDHLLENAERIVSSKDNPGSDHLLENTERVVSSKDNPEGEHLLENGQVQPLEEGEDDTE